MLFGKSFNPDVDIPDLNGKVIVVTGGNAGLGYQSVLALAKKNAKVYMASRTESKALAAIDSIKSQHPSANVRFLPLDLASFASIRAAAAQFTAQESALHILFNNAGVMATPYSETADGYEIQLGTCHIGHFLLTQLLLPTLLRTAEKGDEVRVVNLASGGHNLAWRGIPLEKDMHEFLKGITTYERYGVAKLANILHARELARRYPQITAVSLHPGIIFSGLYSPMSQNSYILSGGLAAVKMIWPVDEKSGAHNQLWCATSENVQSGGYYLPVGKSRSWLHVYAWESKFARDEELAKRLWEWTEKEVGK